MKSLRTTIRNILLENAMYYQKLAMMFTSGAHNIDQAIEFAETLGYLEVIRQDVQEYNDPNLAGVFGGGKVYNYTLRPNRELRKAILTAHEEGELTDVRFFFSYNGDILLRYEVLN